MNLGEAARYAVWARKTQTLGNAKAVRELVSTMPTLRIAFGDLDSQKMLVGIDGGRALVDLSTERSRVAMRDDFVTKSLGVDQIGDASEATRWCDFLDEVFMGDEHLIDWMHRFVGYSLTGSTAEQVFLFLFGSGANGKSVFLDILKALHGELCRVVQAETLMAQNRSGGGPSPDLARLAGARLAVANETESGKSMAESLVKQIVGGDTMTARELNQGFFEFSPVCKLVIAGNHKPVIRGTDGGIWRRVRLIPFNRVFSPDERDHNLTRKLMDKLPAIAGWAVQGALEWQKRGLRDVPKSVLAATADYKEEQDTMGALVSENTTPKGQTVASSLYDDYRQWSDRCGITPVSMQSFGRQLTERGIAKVKSHGVIKYGIGLADAPY
jgi:P4 family phage/plasmid primase-like protien